MEHLKKIKIIFSLLFKFFYLSLMNALIIINTLSGSGKALDVYYENYNMIVKKYNIEEFFISGESSRQDLDIFFQNKKILKKKLIIGIGGDGTIFEIINLMKKNNISIPLAEIPTGTGNGYFKSLCYFKNIDANIQNSIKIINNYNIIDVNLIEINNNKYARLAISWGLISDIDINTEWMRSIGSFRFDLGGLYYAIKLPSYYGKLIYKINNKVIPIFDKFTFFWAGIVSHPSMDTMVFPSLKFNSNKIAISYITDNITRYEMATILLGLSDGSYIKHPKVNYIIVDNFSLEIEDGIIVIDGEKFNKNKIFVESIENNLKILC